MVHAGGSLWYAHAAALLLSVRLSTQMLIEYDLYYENDG